MIAGHLVLVKISWTYAQMQWFIWLLLSWSLLEPWTLPSQSQLHHFLELIITSTLAANFNDPFHIATFSPNQSPSNLEFFIILNLHIKSASVLNILILSLILILLLLLRWNLVFVITLILGWVLIDVLISELCHIRLLLSWEWRVGVVLIELVVGWLLADILLVLLNTLHPLITLVLWAV